MFDIGGVLTKDTGDDISSGMSEYLEINREKFDEFIKENSEGLTKGDTSLLDFYNKIKEKINSDKSAEEMVSKHLNIYRENSLERDNKILNLIDKLKEKYRVVCLTNIEKEVGDFNWGRGLFNDFDESFISTELGMMKPDKEIYEKVLSELNVNNNEVLFIDDVQENIDGAEKLGIKCIKYRNYDELINDMKKFGVMIN